MKNASPLVAVASVLLVAVVADATVSYTASTLVTSVTMPPVTFAIGSGGTQTRFISGLAVSANKTSFSGTFEEKVGGDVSVKDVVDLAERTGSASRTITLTGSHVTNANVLTFTWTVKNGSTTIATLDLLAASPTCSFTLPASATFALDERLRVLPGAGHNNATVSFTLAMRVT